MLSFSVKIMPPRKRKIPNQDPEARTKHKHDKPKNLEQAIVCANDDFETQPRKKLKIMAKDPKKGKIVVKGESSNPAQIRRVQRVKDYPVLINRTTTLSLVDSIQKLNDRQRKAVREIGFENILELNIKELPLRLAYWVVDNFDSRDCQLSLKKRRSLQIEEEDVYRIFRFPRGTQKIEPKKNERTKNEVLEQWYGFFENRYKIVSPMLAEELLKHEDGGIWFKRHFVILLIVSLIANTSDGYIHPFIMHHLIDVDNLKNLNWAQYLISCLVDRKSAWETKKQAFGGPTLFLTLFYLDRVKFKSMTVSRSYPICVNWNYIKIKERELKEIEAGGFGFGLPCEPITCTETDVIDQDAAEQQPKSTPILEGCVTELLQDAREIANKLVKFVTKLEKAPVEAFDDINFRRTMENAHQMIGYNISEKYKDLEAGPSEIRESQLDNAFWQQPEVIKAFDEIVDAVFKRKEYIDNLDNGPNFKLGISQMFPPSQEDDDPQGTKENEPKDNQVNDDDMVIADQDYILSTPTSPQMREHEVHDQVQQKNIEAVVKEGDQYSKEKDNEKSDEDEGDEAEENEESETEKEKEYTENLKQVQEQNMVEPTNLVYNRTRKTTRTETLLSPFVIRPLNPSENITADESALAFYALHNADERMRMSCSSVVKLNSDEEN